MERSLRGKPRSDGDNLGRRSLHHLDLESREMAAREPLLIPFIWSRESSSGRMREIGVISVLFPLGKELWPWPEFLPQTLDYFIFVFGI